jgi:hypothetical protein
MKEIALLVLSMLALNVHGQADEEAWIEETAPVFLAHHYTAELDLVEGVWRLEPIDGEDQVFSFSNQACAVPSQLEAGVWYLSAEPGITRLIAPSSVSEQSFLMEQCGSVAGARSVQVPSQIIEWLREHTGAIHVRRG